MYSTAGYVVKSSAAAQNTLFVGTTGWYWNGFGNR